MNTTSASGNNPASSPIVSSSRTHGSEVSSFPLVRRPKSMPASSNLEATRLNRSGLRGARINKRPGFSTRNCPKAAITASSSSISAALAAGMVLAAITTQAGRAEMSASSRIGFTGEPASYFKFPKLRSCSAVAPSCRYRSRSFGLCAAMRSGSCNTALKTKRQRRYRGNAWSEIRPLTIAKAQLWRFTSRKSAGQISVSSTTAAAGRIRRRMRAMAKG